MDDIICLFCKHRQPLSGGCKAFPDEIPFEFSSGEKEHREKVEGQTGDYVFEEGEPEELKALEEKNNGAKTAF